MLNLINSTSDVYIPDGVNLEEALRRVNRVVIAAHQDDIEIMAFHGILEAYKEDKRGFLGIVCTDGAGSPRTGVYANYTDEMMKDVRREEQRQAAAIGRFSAIIQLNYPSSVIKDRKNDDPSTDLINILNMTNAKTVYTHNLADKHPTHIAVALNAVKALRKLSADKKPDSFLGCEVWRDLDWMPDDKKVPLNVSGREHLAAALLGVFDSQIAGGKRYDLAAIGRRRANATYFASHGVDQAEELSFAMDLTELIKDEKVNISEYVIKYIDEFKKSVEEALQ